jgi:hypothetical protein
MKKACLVVDKYLMRNKIFDASLHRDNCTDKYIKLKEAMYLKSYDLSTQDINSIEESEIVIYASEIPKKLPDAINKRRSYLILTESSFIRPDNYNLNTHSHFQKIFTWSDDLVDNENYIKLNFAHSFPKNINKDLTKKKKLCTLIAANKKPFHKLDTEVLELDLYSEREKAIRWFEQHHLTDFDLYGIGWEKFLFSGPKLVRALNRIPWIPELTSKVLGRLYPSYKGPIEHKKPVLEQYRFSICYENARDISGYITEKIFDSFFAGCIPIYWGASNITDYIPEKCFIDKRKYDSYEELHRFLTAMSETTYRDYLDNIEIYLNSSKSLPFKSEGFVDTIMKTIFEKRR